MSDFNNNNALNNHTSNNHTSNNNASNGNISNNNQGMQNNNYSQNNQQTSWQNNRPYNMQFNQQTWPSSPYAQPTHSFSPYAQPASPYNQPQIRNQPPHPAQPAGPYNQPPQQYAHSPQPYSHPAQQYAQQSNYSQTPNHYQQINAGYNNPNPVRNSRPDHFILNPAYKISKEPITKTETIEDFFIYFVNYFTKMFVIKETASRNEFFAGAITTGIIFLTVQLFYYIYLFESANYNNLITSASILRSVFSPTKLLLGAIIASPLLLPYSTLLIRRAYDAGFSNAIPPLVSIALIVSGTASTIIALFADFLQQPRIFLIFIFIALILMVFGIGSSWNIIKRPSTK